MAVEPAAIAESLEEIPVAVAVDPLVVAVAVELLAAVDVRHWPTMLLKYAVSVWFTPASSISQSGQVMAETLATNALHSVHSAVFCSSVGVAVVLATL